MSTGKPDKGTEVAVRGGHRSRLNGPGGGDGMTDDRATLEEYSNDHSAASTRCPLMITRPKNRKELQEIMINANAEGLSLIPVSSGPPRFRGDTVPLADGAVIVDMREMNAIEWIDRRNRVAAIEPGVTFDQLEPELEKEGMRLSMPLCPKSTKSAIAAYWEREPLTNPRFQWDVTDPLACSEFLAGTGEVLYTGEMGANPGTPEEQKARGYTFKAPFGICNTNLEKLGGASQGSLGICQWASVRCELLPEYEKIFAFAAETPRDLSSQAFRLLYDRLADDIYILNAVNLACLLRAHSGDIRRLTGELPPWMLVFTVTGYGVKAKSMFSYKLAQLEELGRRLKETAKEVNSEELEGLLRRPSAEPYWKLRLAGDVRELFFLTSVSRAPFLVIMVQEMAVENGFPLCDMGVYVQPQRQGCHCHLEFDFYFAREDTEGRERVEALVAEAARKALEAGGFFSRPYGGWSDMVFALNYAVTARYLNVVKGVLDPNGVMSPGRLCFTGGEAR